MMVVARRALVATIVLTLLTGVLYPLLLTAVGRVVFVDEAQGSLIRQDGRIVGSRLVGQAWEGERWMYGRPSATDYDAGRSGGSNLGPASGELTETISQRAGAILAIEAPYHAQLSVESIPPDLLLASGSGLDPEISLEAALLQAPRLASIRGLPVQTVVDLIHDGIRRPPLDLFGQSRVNVLEINLALEELGT